MERIARPGRRGPSADARDCEQDDRSRAQDQRDREQDRRAQAMDAREQAQDERERQADHRQHVMDLYREAVGSSPSGAVERGLWTRADSRALLARRQESVARDTGALDREDDLGRRDRRHAAREQDEVDRQTDRPLPSRAP